MRHPAIESFSDIHRLMADLPAPDPAALAAAEAREAVLTKPAGALGRLEALAAWVAGWQGRHPPRLERTHVLVFAGNHGVAGRGVSAFPAEVTAQMVANFQAGGAAINQLCDATGAELVVRALDLDRPTADFTVQPAMGEADCVQAVAAGMAAVEPDLDLICVGEMGIANTTSAAALCGLLFGGAAADWVGPGTGVAADGLRRKSDVVAAAMALHGGCSVDPLAALARVGGREIAAMAGAILAARLARVPVLLDGYVCSAAAAVLHALTPTALAHCQAGHVSAEPAHAKLLALLEKSPLLDLGMRLGEASGAAVAIAVVRCAVATHAGMATFADAGVAKGSDASGGEPGNPS